MVAVTINWAMAIAIAVATAVVVAMAMAMALLINTALWGRFQGNKKVTWKKLRRKKKTFFFCFFEKFWLGGAAPQTPRVLAGGAKPPQTPP